MRISKVHRNCLHWRNWTRRHFWTLRAFQSFFVQREGKQPVKLHPDKESCRFKAIEKSHLSSCRLACGFTIANMTYDSSQSTGDVGRESILGQMLNDEGQLTTWRTWKMRSCEMKSFGIDRHTFIYWKRRNFKWFS